MTHNPMYPACGPRGDWRRKLLALTLALPLVSLAACEQDDDDDTAEPEPAVFDMDGDTDRNGTLDGSEAEDAIEADSPGLVLLVNVDDDNSDGETDEIPKSICGDENDLVPVVIQPEALAEAEDGSQIRLVLDGDVGSFRVYWDGTAIIGSTGDDTKDEITVDNVEGTEPQLSIEGVEFNGRATLTATLLGPDGDDVGEDVLALSTSPMMLFSNLDTAEMLWVGDDNMLNQLMREGIEEAIGAENVTEYSVNSYGYDVWVQDEFEFTYQQTPGGPMQMVLDSIRNRGLDDLAEDEMLGPDFGWLERGETMSGNSLDAFGNLDCSPPLNEDYPLGRIYYGGTEAGMSPYQVDAVLREFLDDQIVQAPLEIDTTWLAVGHVDEFMAFIPDATSDKGFRLLWADYVSAVEILEGLDPNMALTRFADDHGYATVGEILEDGIVEYNEDLATDHLDPLKAQLMDEFGLVEDEFLIVPGLYENVYGGYALSLIPGMVNLAVWNDTLLIADPFFREWNGADEEDANGNYQLDDGEDLNGDGMLNTYNDPFVQFMEDTMPAQLELVFLDNWNDYHLMMGEVHCGTNIVRTPVADPYWWEVE